MDTQAEEELEQAMRELTLAVEVDLLPQDANSLRMQVHKMLTAYMEYERKQILLSDLMMEVVNTGDGQRVIAEIRRQSDPRRDNLMTLHKSGHIDWRLMILTSPDMSGENIEHWLPEYKGRWKEIEDAGSQAAGGGEETRNSEG